MREKPDFLALHFPQTVCKDWAASKDISSPGRRQAIQGLLGAGHSGNPSKLGLQREPSTPSFCASWILALVSMSHKWDQDYLSPAPGGIIILCPGSCRGSLESSREAGFDAVWTGGVTRG